MDVRCVIFCILIISSLPLGVLAAEDTVTEDGLSESGITQIPIITLKVERDGTVSVYEELIVTAGTLVRREVPSNVYGLEVMDSTGSIITYRVRQDGITQIIEFILEDLGTGEERITLLYRTNQFTSKLGDVWSLDYSAVTTPHEPSQFGTTIKLYAPEGAQIMGLKPRDYWFTPRGSSEIWIYPTVSNLVLTFNYSLTDASTTSTTSTTLPVEHSSGTSEIMLYLIVFTALIGLVAVFLAIRRKSGLKKESEEGDEGLEGNPDESDAFMETSLDYGMGNDSLEVENSGSGEPKNISPEGPGIKDEENSSNSAVIRDSLKNMFDENESKIIELLESSEGEITQAYIYKSTGIPKSSLSEIIKRLEKRNIIERTKDGRTNWIKLKNWVLE